jgi:hypothetical protein
MRRSLLAGIGFLLALIAGTFAARPEATAPPAPNDEAFARLLNEIRPQPGEDVFDTIPWQISLHEARVKAAKEGKPILLWEMDGHPLGCG